MNALARYLLVFLLGWSGAVWSYSDLIYKESETSQDIKELQKTNDISLPESLKLPPSNSVNQKGTENEPSIKISGNKQPTERKTVD